MIFDETNELYPLFAHHLAVGIAGLLGLYRPRWDLVIARPFLATFPIIILFLFMQKQFIAGIASLGTSVEK